MRPLIPVLLLAAGCKIENEPILRFGENIATTAGDFDDVAAPFDRMVVNQEQYEGLISTATWDDDYDADGNSLKVEDLLGEQNDIRASALVVIASGTRGLGKRQYNGLEPDDQFVGDEDSIARVRGFVNARGVLVVTDWAYDLVEQAWPEYVEFLGDDTEFDAAQAGELMDVTATITDDRLSEALEVEEWRLRYDFSNWAVIESVDEDDVEVWMRGDVAYRVRDGEGTETLTDVPLLVSFRPEGPDKGYVVVSTFHLDAQTPQMIDEMMRTVVGHFEEHAGDPVEPIGAGDDEPGDEEPPAEE